MNSKKEMSSRSVFMRDINTTLLSAPISRIKALRDDEGRRGFTLIEVLVVVLIIVVLAAIALPQYQLAVKKAKLQQLIVTAKSLKEALEIHYLEYGTYIGGNWVFRIARCPSYYKDMEIRSCGGGVMIDALDGTALTAGAYDSNIKMGYVIWLDRSARPGEAYCLAAVNDIVANRVCRSMGGVPDSQKYGGGKHVFGGHNSYKL